jgi:hypothetical protein
MTLNSIVGTVLAIAGLLIAVVALTPGEWDQKITAWHGVAGALAQEVYANKLKLLLVLLLGCALGYGVKSSRSTSILSPSEFEKKFCEIFDNNDIRTLCIFGYTFETVRDYAKYDHYYIEGLTIRVLNRNWFAERADEDAHNQRIEKLDLRPWKKAETIQKAAETPWTYKAQRVVRYYDFTHPLIKGTILKSKSGVWAFVNFYEWQEMPRDGGSQFKGADLGMIFLDGARPHERLKIIALESQFELIWKYRSYPKEKVAANYRTYLPSEPQA